MRSTTMHHQYIHVFVYSLSSTHIYSNTTFIDKITKKYQI